MQFAALLEETWRKAHILIDDKIGVLRSVTPRPNPPGLPPLFRYEAHRCSPKDVSGNVVIPYIMNGYGFKFNDLGARMAAVGEALERYCCSVTAGHELIESDYRHLPGRGIDPTTIVRPHVSQKPVKILDADTEMLWVRGTHVMSEQPWWAPADLVFMPSPQPWAIRDQVSTGLACGSSFWHAAYAGLCEVIERDSFILMWLLKLPVPRIALDSITDPVINALLRKFKEYSIHITINDITTDLGIPAFLVTGEMDRSWPRVWVSASVSVDPVQALRSALEESFGTLAFLMETQRVIASADEVVDMHDHSFYYADGKGMEQFRFFLETDEHPFNPNRWVLGTAESYEQSFHLLASRLSHLGYDAYTVDLSTADIDAADLHVVRTIVPNLQWLHHRHPCLESERLHRYGRHHGIDTTRDLNLTVHPFP